MTWTADRYALALKLLAERGLDLSKVPITPREEVLPDCPLSFAQERLWFLHQLEPDSVAYDITLNIPIAGAVAPALIERAFTALLDRHTILRTVFPSLDGNPVQRLTPAGPVAIPLEDLQGLEVDSRWERLLELTGRAAATPYDLARGPLIRPLLVKFDDASYMLICSLHHIVVDGWSIDILIRDFYALLQSAGDGAAGSLPPLPIQYADYAAWQRKTLTDAALAGTLAFWTGKLAGLTPLRLPVDRAPPDRRTGAGARESLLLSPEAGEGLQALCRREGVTLYEAALAAFNVTLARTSGQTDLVLGTPVANRERAEISQLVGFFVNMLVVRTDLSGASTLRAALERTKSTMLDAHAHKEMPFEKLVAALAGGRDPGRHPLFQATFALDQSPSLLPDHLRSVAASGMANEPIRFDLEASIGRQPEGFRLSVAFSTELFDPPTIRRLLERFAGVIEEFSTDLDRPLADGAGASESWMSTVEYLGHLRSLDVQVFLEEDRLRVNAPPGVLTPDRRAELARRKADILSLLRPASGSLDPVLSAISRDGDLPVSLAQQRLWFLDRMDPGNASYHIAGALRISGALDAEAAARAVDEIVRRQESLRTTFPTVDGTPRVVIAAPGAQRLDQVDLRALGEAEREQAAGRALGELARRPFDLARGPLFRATLIKLGDREQVFAFCMHHIISDGWSLTVLGRELATLYAAFAAGRPSPLPALRIQYVDYAAWQGRRLDGRGIAAQERYWAEQLRGRLPILQLSADRPRPPVQTFRGARSTVVVPGSLVNALKELSRTEGASLFMTLLAAFKTLLHRYTGEEDLLVGSPTANRSHPELENVIGFFVNTLVLRTDMSGNPSFRELLGRVRRVLLQAHANQDVSFDRLVEMLRPERDIGHSPLFQVMFNSPTTPTDTAASAATGNREVQVEVGTARFDLTVEVYEEKVSTHAAAEGLWKSSGLKLAFEYNTDLFDPETIARMQGHFTCLLEAIADQPDERIAVIPMLTAPESDTLLRRWNATTASFQMDSCVHELFESQTDRTPDAIALVHEDEALSYAELDRRANRLARRLRTLGTGPGELVGIYLERSTDMVVAVLATLKAGGAYVPLDPAYPAERLGFMVADARIPVLLTTEALRERIPGYSGQAVCLDAEREAIAREPATRFPGEATAGSLAYVIYTSGSTGTPKGVEITHRSVVNFLTSMRREPGLVSADRLLSVTTLSFDIAGLELYLPLMVGARIVLAGSTVASDASRLLALLAASGATVMQATPATWRLLLEAGWEGSNGLKVLCGGEVLPRDLAEQLLSRAASVWNLYGPTEATIWSLVQRVEPGEGPVPIGRPIANTTAYVLDSAMRPVPIGVPGELYLGGSCLARGYFERADLTAERFVPDPFGNAGARLYKTGDLARFRPSGAVEWLGRGDGQIKIRGFRVELGEIEAALHGCPDVRQAAVTLAEPRPGDQRLQAYIVPVKGRKPAAAELMSALRARLPDYMIPSSYTLLDALPLTPNGKVDHRALPSPDGSGSASGPGYASPRTETERMIASVWSEVLGVAQVGLHDNFFDLGGHSLLIVRVHGRLEKLLGDPPPLIDFFRYPTVASLAGRIAHGPADESGTLERAEQRARRQLEA